MVQFNLENGVVHPDADEIHCIKIFMRLPSFEGEHRHLPDEKMRTMQEIPDHSTKVKYTLARCWCKNCPCTLLKTL